METPAPATAEFELLEAFLRKNGLKLTRARAVVLQAFLSIEQHVSAEELFEAARVIDGRIGQATVFRTIKLLAESGVAREARSDKGGRQYERAFRRGHHDHLVCLRCGTVVEFADSSIEAAQAAVYAAHGFSAIGHQLELVGICPRCTGSGGQSGRPVKEA
ncbi:MAG: Fur family transcriptional regulator [Spirochaetota bacterium]